MKFTFPHLTMSALALGLGLSFTTLTSCKDNDLSDGGHNSGSDSEIIDEKAAQKYSALENLLGALGNVDSLPDNWNSADYHVNPTIGEAENEASPYAVRLVATANADEANREFRSIISAPLGGAAKDTTWTQEGIGSLTFKVLQNDPTCYATVSVDMQQMPSLQEIRFVPASVIGNNAGNKTPYYQFGDIIKQTIGSKETYWVCVRPASNKSASLKKTHWCTFQLLPKDVKNSNYKKINDDNYLPTDLCAKRADGVRMTQNFFNVLRMLANPKTLSETVNLDKIIVQDKKAENIEFSQENAKQISFLWNYNDYWKNVCNERFNSGIKDELTNSYSDFDFKEYIGSENALVNAFFYGYSSILFGKGDYRVYNLKLGANPTNGLFTNAQEVTPWLLQSNAHDFSEFEESGSNKNFELEGGEAKANYEHQYIVKYRTGGQFDDTWTGNDKDIENSFTDRSSNGIEDVFVSKKVLAQTSAKAGHGFYVTGDYITTTNNTRQVCVKGFQETYSNMNEEEAKRAYFLHVQTYSYDKVKINENVIADKLSDKLAHIILLQLVRAHEYATDNKKNNIFALYKIPDSNPQKQFAENLLGNLYTLLARHYVVTEVGDKKELKVNLKTKEGTSCYKVVYDKKNNTFDFSKEAEEADLETLTVCSYLDNMAYTETHSSTCIIPTEGNTNFRLNLNLISEIGYLREVARHKLSIIIENCLKE